MVLGGEEMTDFIKGMLAGAACLTGAILFLAGLSLVLGRRLVSSEFGTKEDEVRK